MKDDHKNMLLGYLAGKGSSKNEDDIVVQAINYILVVSFSLGSAIFGTISLKDIIYMSDDRATGFGVLIFVICIFFFSYLIHRFRTLIYLLIFGPPVIYFLIWLFFLSS